jgi:RNA 3'-terminal phosphate cyclase (ATP)
MLTIDGSRYSGSGTIVRQAVALAALTGRSIRLVKARTKRVKPGLRPQHVRVVEAIAELVNGRTEGLMQGTQEFTFRPGAFQKSRRYHWDIGSAGSTTMLALGILPVLAFTGSRVTVELRGGLFQDFAPSLFHLQYVLVPLLQGMGLDATVEMERPGYVPQGNGILRLTVNPVAERFRAIRLDEPGPLTLVWGIALSSHLQERRVSERMAQTAQEELAAKGYRADIEVRYDNRALQRGAVLALFADRQGGVRLGADRAGALRRSAESVGTYAARQLVDDVSSGATVDRFAADQLIPFAAMAAGETRLIIPMVTDHIESSAWLAQEFLGAHVTIGKRQLTIQGVGFRPELGRP